MLFLLLAVLSDCATPDRAFIGTAIRTWDAVRVDSLHVDAAPLPRLVFFDERCVIDGERVYAHHGQIKLPSGDTVPPQLMTFAGTYDGQKPFLIQALPPVWRTVERHRDNPHLDRLMRAVFVHEMTHTVQTRAFGERLTALETLYKIENLNDDIVQDRFKHDPEYVKTYQEERALLYSIAAERDAVLRKELAREAVKHARARRARYFTGDSAWLAEIEEIFLGMEGAAQWAAYRAAILDGATHEEAILLMTRGGRVWSQDEGLALFLAIDALMPGQWQEKVFGATAVGAWDLLEEAAR
ncbi:MAG TPA: hypothetical protein VF911_04330 [Thermoanaerobaculia bacterium]|jgi:hypothetical protein